MALSTRTWISIALALAATGGLAALVTMNAVGKTRRTHKAKRRPSQKRAEAEVEVEPAARTTGYIPAAKPPAQGPAPAPWRFGDIETNAAPF